VLVKRILALITGLVVSGLPIAVALDVQTVHASSDGVFVFNTQLSSNSGLGFCTTTAVKGCIDSVTIDGIALRQVNAPGEARYGIGGGVYSAPCKFMDTSVTQCEYPYMVIYPMVNTPNSQISMTNVEVNFRRRLDAHKTSAVNTVIVNGSLQSFVPAAPGLRDIATINARTTQVHSASSGLCLGWVIAIDSCTIGDVSTSTVSNRISMLLLPAMRSAIVPPDAADAECKRIDPTSNCFVNIFDASSQGGWVDTDASVFGLASTDRFTGAAQLKIAGPHFKAAVNGVNDLNLANFRMYLPSAYLMNSFGLTPDQANAVTLPVKRTARDGSTVPVTEYIPSADGLLVSTTGIGFSIPTMTVQRILVVKRNQTLSANSLLKAAGVFQTRSLGPAKITVNAPHGMRFNGKRYSFTRTRNVRVTIQYQSSKKSKSVRYLTVKVVK
jgi:hypothetical protein